jgi:4a-hydroxytetrahydrobiopterin dehydratase
MAVLSESAIQEKLKAIPAWKLESGEIVRTYKFSDFLHSLQFVNLIGEKAEDMGHHPDINIRYNKVRLAVVSHDAGGLTDADFALAAVCDLFFVPGK